ncbi:MAG TPA: outer membrane beta-barrel family protein [Xanthomarina sp.]|nr:outer membrane beta-barrel family protein [Xanthomarina sp.]
MKNLFFVVLTLISLKQHAQNSAINLIKDGTITGTVLDKADNQPLPYVTIVIKDEANNTLTGSITDDSGEFKISDIPLGKVIVNIQFIGYKTITKNITLSKDNNKTDLGNIYLEEEATGLDEITVVAEVSTIQQKVDRKVITVGKDLTTVGSSASEIMNNLPAVSVDSQSGDISLRGNDNVRVLVDGKPTNVPASQLLKQIPSTSIKSIELITNPSAKYNPEGMSGIINIILHKNTNIGFNGSIDVGIAKENHANFNSAIDMNYRNGKFNFYGNYGNNIGKSSNHGFINRFDDNSTQLFDFGNNNKSHLYKIGVDYYINNRNTFSIYTNQNLYDGKGEGRTDILYPDENGTDFRQIFYNEDSNNTSTYNASYKHDFEKEGHNILLEADYSIFESDETSNFNFTGGVPGYIDLVNNGRNNTVINLDYVNPLSEKSKLELGLEYRDNNSDNDYNTSNANLFDSNYSYDRNIYSFYSTFGQTFEKWSYQIGARIEQYDVAANFNQFGGEQAKFTDDQFSVYPSAFFSYNPSEKNTYQLSISRRVDRPGLGQINPIREWSTPRVTSVGNPNLKQQFTNSVELNYTRNLEKGSITAGGFYRIINDEISRSVSFDPEDPNGDRLLLSYDNFDKNSAYGFEFSTNYRPTKWWNLNASAEYYFKTINGIVQDANAIPTSVEIDNATFNFRLNTNIKASKHLSFSVFGMYRGEDEGLQVTRKPMIMVNTGLRYTFLDDKATFSFGYNDIFNTMKFAFDGYRPYESKGEFNWESNQWRVGLNYRFGGNNKYRALQRKNRDNNTSSGNGGFL